MVKQHTAQSLARYLGHNVKCSQGQGILLELRGTIIEGLSGIDDNSSMATVLILSEGGKPHNLTYGPIMNFFPVLKPYQKLIEPMMWEGKEIQPIKEIYGYEDQSFIAQETGIYGHSMMDFEYNDALVLPDFSINKFEPCIREEILRSEKIVRLGFGAIEIGKYIPEEDPVFSPTGYVDLFGYPCLCEE